MSCSTFQKHPSKKSPSQKIQRTNRPPRRERICKQCSTNIPPRPERSSSPKQTKEKESKGSEPIASALRKKQPRRRGSLLPSVADHVCRSENCCSKLSHAISELSTRPPKWRAFSCAVESGA